MASFSLGDGWGCLSRRASGLESVRWCVQDTPGSPRTRRTSRNHHLASTCDLLLGTRSRSGSAMTDNGSAGDRFLDREAAATGLPLRWLIGISLLVHVVTLLLAVSPWHPDEQFQVLEFAFARAGYAPLEILPWEYHQQIRSALQPTVAMMPLVFLRALGIDSPFVWVLLLRLLTLVAAASVTVFVISRVSPTLSRTGRRWLWLSSLFLWFVPFLHFRFTGENLGGMALAAAVVLLITSGSPDNRRGVTGAGLLLGLSFVLRFQMLLAVVGLLGWAALDGRNRWGRLARLTIAAALVVMVSSLVDAWFYGNWVFTPWEYFRANIVEGAAVGFGTSPWHWYLTRLPLWMAPPLGFMLAALFLAAVLRSPRSPWVWLSVAFLAGHTLVGHKELRFLFPLIYVVPVLLALGAQAIQGWTSRTRWSRAVGGVLATQNVLLLALMSTPLPHRATDVDGHYLRFLWDRAEASSGQPVYVLHDGPAPYALWELSIEVYRHPGVRNIQIEAGARVDQRVPPDTPPARLLLMTTDSVPPELAGATVTRLAYQAEPAYQVLARLMGGEEWRWVGALRQLSGWDDSDWVRRVYEVRLGNF